MFTIVTLSLVLSNELLDNAISISMFILLSIAVIVYTKIFKTIKNRAGPGNATDLNDIRAANRESKRNFLKNIKLAINRRVLCCMFPWRNCCCSPN